MRKIEIVSDQKADSTLIQILFALFPECNIEITPYKKGPQARRGETIPGVQVKCAEARDFGENIRGSGSTKTVRFFSTVNIGVGP